LFLEKLIWSYPLVIVLIITHVFLTFKLKFPQKNIFKGFKLLFGNRSSFNILMTVLSGTIGIGNIVGVASAVIIGGIGSIFWMFIAGFFAIATKYAETYICLKYRKKEKNEYIGGAMYVLKDRIGNNFLAMFFSVSVILASFGIGCMIQSNSATNILISNFNINIDIVVFIITGICLIYIFLSENILKKISGILIPISTVIYLYLCIVIIYIFRDNLVTTINNIIIDAFNIKSGAVGIFAFFSLRALSIGMSRGIFSNEAGMGSSPILSCSTTNNNLEEQSIISSISVFIDTVVLCTLTGIALVISNQYINETNAINLVNNVFSNTFMGNYLIMFCLIVFAISSIPCWSYYGKIAVKYIFKSNFYVFVYKVIYVICIYIGCVTTLNTVWSLSSIANACMIIPNIYMIYYLIKEIK
ncbi:MAG: amino acid carrier protein, partial [Clostridia bacterium]